MNEKLRCHGRSASFDKVKGPKVKSMMYVFKRRVEANKGRGVVVLTARDPKAKRSISGYLSRGDWRLCHEKLRDSYAWIV